MPFNASGVFQRLFNWRDDRDHGIEIRADRMDQEMDGIVAGINDIVSANVDWKGPMTGVFGTAAAPAYSFQEDPNTGVYRVSADVLGFSVGGTLKVRVSASDVTFDGHTMWHAGNDGANSGLDADLLDGQHGAFYQNAGNLNAGTVPVARLPTSVLRSDVANQAVPSYFKIKSGAGSGSAVLELVGPDDIADAHFYTNNAAQAIGLAVFDGAGAANRKDFSLYYNGTITWAGNTVWHSGNDGAGSGLDADLVDGLHGTQFMRNDVDASSSGNFGVQKTASSAVLFARADAGQFKYISVGSGVISRFDFGADSAAETGGNNGSNFFINRFSDTGTYLGRPVEVMRKNGVVRLHEQPKLHCYFGAVGLNARASFGVDANIGGFVLTNNNETVTVPATGWYRIRWQALSGAIINGAHNHLFLFRNGASVWVGTAHVRDFSAAAGEALQFLNEGDYIELKCTNGGTIHADGAFNKFQIFFMG